MHSQRPDQSSNRKLTEQDRHSGFCGVKYSQNLIFLQTQLNPHKTSPTNASTASPPGSSVLHTLTPAKRPFLKNLFKRDGPSRRTLAHSCLTGRDPPWATSRTSLSTRGPAPRDHRGTAPPQGQSCGILFGMKVERHSS